MYRKIGSATFLKRGDALGFGIVTGFIDFLGRAGFSRSGVAIELSCRRCAMRNHDFQHVLQFRRGIGRNDALTMGYRLTKNPVLRVLDSLDDVRFVENSAAGYDGYHSNNLKRRHADLLAHRYRSD